MSKIDYKAGDWVWIRKDLELEKTYSGKLYRPRGSEEDIRGTYQKIIFIGREGERKFFNFSTYSFLGLDAIDHEKSSSNQNYYEVY